ncbi:hypothetical protein LJC58_09820, partial [Lachnospiraceae bacterium OttesenSCG-928-D06]|nr:hypothetical protein [Lachnospiraceae bacterium OttesenSCG-928-D06]
MPTTIESLELEVQSSATSATSGIDALSASLSKLKSAVKGGVGLTSVINQLKGLNTALQGIDASSAGKIDTLANSLSKLSGLGQLKISSTIANQLKNIGSAATALNGVDFSGIGKLSSALQPLSNMGKSNLTSFITQLNKLPQLAQTLNGMNIAQFTAQIQQLANALAPLASQLNMIGTAFTRLPTNIQRVATATNAMATANNTASKSYVNLWAKCRMARNAVMSIARVIASWITEANSYIEDVNLFTASMGEYAAEAKEYAEAVGEVMGIDPGDFMRNQGIFMTITKGFGVASDKAYLMSKNLTQLGYDLSSFFNIPFEESMQKLTSGISGELEPLRRLGYDLSVARLQQEAYNLGIDKSVQKMTQAEKSQLRYYAIMTQVTTAQGDMARTLNAPANQLRVLSAQVKQCARALGQVFIPVLNAVLPYLIAFAKVLRMIINIIGKLAGFTMPEVDYSGISGGASAVGDLADAEGDATKAAKKLKNALSGIDELNIISPNDDSSSGSGSGLVGGGDLGIDLPEYDFLGDAINSKVDEIVAKLKPFIDWLEKHMAEVLKVVEAIGVAFLAWKIANGIIDALKFIQSLKNLNLNMNIGFKTLGLAMFLADLNEFMKYFEDFKENGATFQNVTGMISEFTGLVGDALIILGALKIGGALKVVQGIGEICVAVKDISESGVNWSNATTAIRGLTNIAIGIGVFTGNIKLAAWSVALQGFVSIVGELGENWEAIKQGDWSGVDKVTLIVGGLEILGGLVVALDVFSKLKGLTSLGQSTQAMTTVANTTGQLDTTVGTSLVPKLTSLVKNLALGLVVIVEVAAAALLITGAIILLGMELDQVGIAWQPVITNAGTVAIAMGVGVVLLAAIGAVTALLGSVGTSLIVNLVLGIAMLALVGVSAGLFIAEIWAVGKGLEQVGIAWQPVLDNGEAIATAIAIGTGLLIGIGAV